MKKTEPESSGAPRVRRGPRAAADPEVEEALERLAAGGLRSGPATAWALFDGAWSRLLDRLTVFVRCLRVPDELREDCAQATLVRMWRGRTGYRGSSRDELFAWMYRICEREFLRLAEREARSPMREADLALAEDRGDALEASCGDTTADAVESRDRRRALDECVDALEGLQRRAVELLYAATPCTEREAARLLEVSKSYVNVLRRKALHALERCLRAKGAT